MVQAYLAGECLFCDPLGPKNKVLHEVGGWRMWENPFPAPHTTLHLVLASVRHVAPKDEIMPDDFAAIGALFGWARERYSDVMLGGGLLMRFGSPVLTAGTILHLHANILVPDLSGEVRPALAETRENGWRQALRMRVFEKLRHGANLESLSRGERELVEDTF